ncbi:MAG: ECF transporter S component [Oscillospiraceae bacterium]|nr:ECF transporter S component [Oscillospiraceae bacterium]
MQNTRSNHTAKMVALAILAAIIVVLQLFGSMIHIGPVSFSFVLVPIVIGGVLYGPGAGLFLGAVFGALTVAGCISGADPGGAVLWTANPLLTAVLCFLKAMLAGFCSAAVYRLVAKKSSYLGVVLGALSAPVANTAAFCLFLLFPFRSVLLEWAAGTEIVHYMLFTLVGINFLVEVGLNMILCPAIYRIVTVRKHPNP